MGKYPFSESEMQRVYTLPGNSTRAGRPIFDGPVSVAENLRRIVFQHDPVFMPDYRAVVPFNPRVLPDNEARGYVIDGGDNPQHTEGFRDMFGINWIYIPIAMGAMVQPGKPLFDDINDWRDKLTIPDVDAWDWEKQAELSRAYTANPYLPVESMILTGFYERMISMMDFENAAIALIDDDQKEACHEFFDMLVGVYCKIVDQQIAHFHVQGILLHDDWGSQRAPFFSLETVREMLVPHMKKFADYLHAKGLHFNLHSCGMVEPLIPAMIEIGVDMWSGQEMNDEKKLYELYGDKIMIGVKPPKVTADMPPPGDRAHCEGICRCIRAARKDRADLQGRAGPGRVFLCVRIPLQPHQAGKVNGFVHCPGGMRYRPLLGCLSSHQGTWFSRKLFVGRITKTIRNRKVG